MLSSIFIDRPRLAVVISIVITIAGLVALTQIPIAQFPDIVPPQIAVTASYAGAGAEVVEATVGAADRVARHRRRQHDLHEVDQRQRRQLHAHRHVRGRHRSRSQHRQGAEPCQPRRGAAAAGGAQPGRQRHQEVVGAAADRHDDVAGRPLRPAVPEQLRDHQHHRQPQARARHRRRVAADAGRLQHEGLARQRPDDELRPDAERHRQRDQAQNMQAAVGRIGAQPALPDQQFQLTIQTKGRLVERRGIRAASSCAPIRTARSCACATSRASSLRREAPNPAAGWTALRPR